MCISQDKELFQLYSTFLNLKQVFMQTYKENMTDEKSRYPVSNSDSIDWVSFSSLWAYGILSEKSTGKYNLHQAPPHTLQARILVRKKPNLTMQQDSHLSLLQRHQGW